MRTVTLLLVLSISCICKGQTIEENIDEYIQAILQCSDIPGVSLAVVRDNEVFLTKGYGVKDIATGEAMNRTTQILLASVSKAISGVAMASVLAEQDRDEAWWDTPVRSFLGDEFYLNDATRTEQSNLRDMFAHRLGIPRHDDLRMSGYGLQEFVSKLRFLEFDYDFRDRYRYQNIMYSVSELSLNLLGGKSYQQVLQENLFTPLGMSRSTLITDESVWDAMSAGYYLDNGELREVSKEVPKAYYGIFAMSGGVVSCAEDMAQWIQFQLNEGTAPDGTEILSEVQFRDTHVPLIQRTASPTWARPEFPVTYAPPHKYSTGWQESTYRDYELFTHTGSQGGFRTQLVIVPSLGHGVFVGVNKSPDGNVRDLVNMYILDLLMGETPWLSSETVCDYVETRLKDQPRCPDCYVDVEQFLVKTKAKLAKQGAFSDFPVEYANEDFVGVYGDHAYGNVNIEINNNTGGLVMKYGVEEYTFDLTETEPLVYNGEGREPFWFREYGLIFEMDGDQAEAVTISFEEDAPPRFVRDLDFNNPPPPPELCEQ